MDENTDGQVKRPVLGPSRTNALMRSSGTTPGAKLHAALLAVHSDDPGHPVHAHFQLHADGRPGHGVRGLQPYNGDTAIQALFGSPFAGLKYFEKLFTGRISGVCCATRWQSRWPT